MRAIFICYNFAPKNVISAVRQTKFVKYLVREGWDITVITTPIEDGALLDNTLLCKELDHVRIVRISHSTIFRRLFLKARKNFMIKKGSGSNAISKDDVLNHKSNLFYTAKIWAIKRGRSTFCDLRDYDWYHRCKSWINSNLSKEKFDVVFSSYAPVSAHQLGEYIRDKRIVSTWIADFRDPITSEILQGPSEYRRAKIRQQRICHVADGITCVSNPLGEILSRMSKQGNYIPKPVKVIHNGYDHEDLDYSDDTIDNGCKSSKLKIAYTGGLYGGNRDLGALFRAIRELVDAGIVNTNLLEFHYAGKEFQVLKSQASEFSVENILVNHGEVERKSALMIQKHCHITVIVTWNTKEEKGVLPGKLYESFLLKKPVIALINGDIPNSTLSMIIRQARVGVAFEEANYGSDYSSLVNYIQTQYIRVTNSKSLEYIPNFNYMESFKYENLSSELKDFFEKVMSEKNKSATLTI